MSRFGRTSAAHVVDMLDDRFDEVAVPFSQLTLGGQTWRLTERRADTRRVRAGVAPAESNDALPDYTADWSDPSPHYGTGIDRYRERWHQGNPAGAHAVGIADE